MSHLVKQWLEEDEKDIRRRRTLTVIAVVTTVVVGGIIFLKLRMKRKHGKEVVDEKEVMIHIGPGDRAQDPKQNGWRRAIHVPRRVFGWFSHSSQFEQAAKALGKEEQDKGGSPED